MTLERLENNLIDVEVTAESKLLESIANICFDKFLVEKGKLKKAKLVLQESTENPEACDKSPP